ncbi:hypothetical protein RB600_009641 [Gaeumannomyces tritici]
MRLCRIACVRRTYLSILGNPSHICDPRPPSPALRSQPCRTSATAVQRLYDPWQARNDGVDMEPAPGGPTSLEWIVQKHMQYLGDDPFKIARHVQAAIARGRFEEALLLTRKASKVGQLTVSWNHLIEHLLTTQRLHAALKLYNEMKKRAQLPNAQTYTIIFSGCAISEHPKLAVAEALRIYSTMLNSDRLKPNVAHLNAVLKVCSRAGDLESLFTLLQGATGTRSPNALTYTTILNALRVKELPLKPSAEMADFDAADRLETHHAKVDVSIQRGKRVWDEIMDQWRHGKVVVDEALVCAMGRLLLSGDKSTQEEVLSLVEQTMGIPRLESRSNSAKARRGRRDGIYPPAEPKPEPPSAEGYAKPGNNTLSMIMHCLGATRKTALAPRYWDMLVDRLEVKPDSDNWFRLLMTLHNGKASTKASKYLTQIPAHAMWVSTPRLVMRTCVADSLNVHAFENAERVLDVAIQTWHGKPDMATMNAYLEVATATHHRFRRVKGEEVTKEAAAVLGNQLVRALDRLWEPMRLATGGFAPLKADTDGASAVEPLSKEVLAVASVARRMTAVANKVLRDKMTTPAACLILRERNEEVSRYITSIFDQGGQQQQPKWTQPGRGAREWLRLRR